MTATADNLARLAGSLPHTQDREAYAALMTYLNSLPPGDEFRRMAEMMGLLSLLGQRVPDALADSMKEMRELTERAGDYYGEIDARLEGLPGAITTGVDVGKMAKQMGEAFRQQLADTGLQNTTALLRASMGELAGISAQLSTAIKPVGLVAATLTGELEKLTAASGELRNQNARLLAEQVSASWWFLGTAALLLFVVGGISGMWLERKQTGDVLVNLNAQMQRLQTPPAPSPVAPLSKRSKRQKGMGE